EVVSALRAAVSPFDQAMILYTSGSTDRPKAVVHRQRAFCIRSQRLADLMDTRPSDRVWSALPLFWTAGLVMGLGSSPVAGGTGAHRRCVGSGWCVRSQRDVHGGDRHTGARRPGRSGEQ